MPVFKRILSYTKPYYKSYMVAAVLLVNYIVLQMVNPYLSGFVVDEIIKGNNRQYLLPICGILILTAVLKTGIQYFRSYIAERNSQKISEEIRHQLYVHIQEMDFHFFDKNHTGELMSRMTGDLDAVRHLLSYVIFVFMECFIYFVTVSVLLFSINWQLAITALILSPFLGWGALRLSKEIKPTHANVRMKFAELNSAASENITGVRVVRSFAQEEQEIKRFEAHSKAYRDSNIFSAQVWAKHQPLLDFLSGASTAFILLLGGWMVMHETISLGTLVSVMNYLWMLNYPMRMVGSLVNDVQRAIAGGEKVFALLDTKPSITNPENAYIPEKFEGHIEFKNVYFKYDDNYVLEDINFDLKPGKTLALVGATGAGKSTIINLINRFYDVDKGTILIDGVDIKKYDLKALREKIGVVMQETFLFSDTVRENIAYGKPDATDEEVINAAKISDAHDFIMELSDQYNTIIGERGIGLSGGQKQRVAIARAIIKNPSILILDDSTSAVDMETEYYIQQQLKKIMKGRTCIIIAHRISSVKNADEILVLDNGRIAERGNHQSLLSRKGIYYKIYQDQYREYLDREEEAVKEVV